MRSIINCSISLVFATLLLSSCKSDTGTPSQTLDNGFSALKSAYAKDPSQLTGTKLINSILESIKTEKNAGKKTELLEYGYKIASEQNIAPRAATFLFPLIKQSSGADTPLKIFDLAGIMKGMNKTSASDVLYRSLIDNHSDFNKIDEAKAALSESMTSVDDYIYKLGEQLFVDTDNTGINRGAAMKYVDACEAYALGYPDNEKTPEILFKSAEVAKSIRTFPKSLALYDWILEKYPNYDKAPTSLFLKGFIIENNLQDDAKAREIYDKFLADYPDHDLADDVEFLIENLGKSDEEILQMIEEKRKAKQASK